MIRPRRVLLMLAFGALAALPLPACANYGEGQQCSVDNGNDDCDTGLTCVSKDTLNTQVDICCPPAATNPACIPGALAGSTTASSTVTATTSTTGGGGNGGGGNGGGGSDGGGGMSAGGGGMSAGGGGMSAGGGGTGGS